MVIRVALLLLLAGRIEAAEVSFAEFSQIYKPHAEALSDFYGNATVNVEAEDLRYVISGRSGNFVSRAFALNKQSPHFLQALREGGVFTLKRKGDQWIARIMRSDRDYLRIAGTEYLDVYCWKSKSILNWIESDDHYPFVSVAREGDYYILKWQHEMRSDWQTSGAFKLDSTQKFVCVEAEFKDRIGSGPNSESCTKNYLEYATDGDSVPILTQIRTVTNQLDGSTDEWVRPILVEPGKTAAEEEFTLTHYGLSENLWSNADAEIAPEPWWKTIPTWILFVGFAIGLFMLAAIFKRRENS